MKRLLIGLLAFVLISCGKKISADPSMVYICTSDNSEAYHRLKNCKQLNKCNRDILYMSWIEAHNDYKREECAICYNR